MHLLQSSMNNMKYLVPCIPVAQHSQRSVCVKSPGFSVRCSLWRGNGLCICLACMHAAQSILGESSLFTVIPVTNPLLIVCCNPLTPICPNQRCQLSQVSAISVERAALSRAGCAVTSSKYIHSTFCPTVINILFLSYRWMHPSPMIACLPLSSKHEMENKLFGACGT